MDTDKGLEVTEGEAGWGQSERRAKYLVTWKLDFWW